MTENLTDTNVGNIEYIERQAAIDACFDGWNNSADDCARNIKSLPAADVVPVVHGRLVKKKDSELFYCSECDLPSMHKWQYCERCGAKMYGGDEHG